MQVIKIPYSPRPQQKVLHDALLKYRFAVCVMHRRGGKTIFSINHLIKEALKDLPPRTVDNAGKSINLGGIVAHLTKAVQELSDKNEALEKRIAELESN